MQALCDTQADNPPPQIHIKRSLVVCCAGPTSVDHCAGPATAFWRMWPGKPGWAAVSEALHRGEHHSCTAADVTSVALSAWRACRFGPPADGLNIFHERTGLIATVRKMMWPHLLLDLVTGQQYRQQWPGYDSYGQPKFGLGDMDRLMPNLVLAVLAIQHWADRHTKGATKGSSGSNIGSNSDTKSGGGRGGSSRISSNRGSSTGCNNRAGSIHNSPNWRMNGNNISTVYQIDPALLGSLHRNEAILVLTLVKCCQWIMQVKEPCFVNRRVPRSDLMNVAAGAISQSLDPHLLSMAVSFIDVPPPSPPRLHDRISAAWERYTVLHFPGMLLLGCCHLDCTNMEGVSEAALMTQLCSGCRRVRYCSVGCQRAAWLKGGHKEVCGIKL